MVKRLYFSAFFFQRPDCAFPHSSASFPTALAPFGSCCLNSRLCHSFKKYLWIFTLYQHFEEEISRWCKSSIYDVTWLSPLLHHLPPPYPSCSPFPLKAETFRDRSQKKFLKKLDLMYVLFRNLLYSSKEAHLSMSLNIFSSISFNVCMMFHFMDLL